MSDNSTMSSQSLQAWLVSLRDGSNAAVERLWRIYFARMVQVARRKLQATNKCVRDEEDIALSAFKSFCLGFQQGRFHADAHDVNLWPVLVSLTINKSIDHIRHLNRAKRGGSGDGTKLSAPAAILDELAGSEPTPDLQAALQESFQNLLNALDATQDSSLRQIALLTLDGNSPSQIAEQLESCSVRTIQRKLKTIRSLWEAANDGNP